MPLDRAARCEAALVGAVLVLGCASTLRTEEHSLLHERAPVINRLAVAPFRPPAGATSGVAERHAAAARLARYVAEAAGERGVAVVAPSDVARALGLEGSVTAGLDAGDIARVVFEEFGAEALLSGVLTRFRERGGEALGTTEPASVAFTVTLYTAPEGEPLWTAVFDETQQPLFANLFNLSRYPGGGIRWLGADEVARWGAREVAQTLPLGR